MADFTPVVTACGLTKSFVGADGEHIEALSDLTLSMPPNVIVSLVGVDGAGKTTFMRHITGLMKADSGGALCPRHQPGDGLPGGAGSDQLPAAGVRTL